MERRCSIEDGDVAGPLPADVSANRPTIHRTAHVASRSPAQRGPLPCANRVNQLRGEAPVSEAGRDDVLVLQRPREPVECQRSGNISRSVSRRHGASASARSPGSAVQRLWGVPLGRCSAARRRPRPASSQDRKRPPSPGASRVTVITRVRYCASFRIWLALVPASLMACSGVALPVMTETYMFVMTSRMSCWPRTFGSGIDVLIAS